MLEQGAPDKAKLRSPVARESHQNWATSVHSGPPKSYYSLNSLNRRKEENLWGTIMGDVKGDTGY